MQLKHSRLGMRCAGELFFYTVEKRATLARAILQLSNYFVGTVRIIHFEE